MFSLTRHFGILVILLPLRHSFSLKMFLQQSLIILYIFRIGYLKYFTTSYSYLFVAIFSQQVPMFFVKETVPVINSICNMSTQMNIPISNMICYSVVHDLFQHVLDIPILEQSLHISERVTVKKAPKKVWEIESPIKKRMKNIKFVNVDKFSLKNEVIPKRVIRFQQEKKGKQLFGSEMPKSVMVKNRKKLEIAFTSKVRQSSEDLRIRDQKYKKYAKEFRKRKEQFKIMKKLKMKEKRKRQEQKLAVKLKLKQKKEERKKRRYLKQKQKLAEFYKLKALKQEQEEMAYKTKEQYQKMKKSERKQFMKQKLTSIKNDFKEMKKRRMKENKDFQKMIEYESQQEELRSMRVNKQIGASKKRRELEENNENQITNFLNSKKIKKYFKDNKVWLEELFNYYMTNYKTDNWQKTNVLPYRGFMRLCAQMNIFPLLMTAREVQLLYRSTTHNQKINRLLLKGINYEEFLQGILRISIKGTQILNAVDAEFKEETISDVQFKNFLKEYSQQTNVEFPSQKEILKTKKDFDYEEMYMNRNALDKYPEIDLFQQHLTLNGLKQFMQIPKTKNALTYKLIKISGKEPIEIKGPKSNKRYISSERGRTFTDNYKQSSRSVSKKKSQFS